MTSSPSLAAAKRGELPAWAVVKPLRKEHIARVAALMEEWSEGLHLPREERERWRAAAWLHDAFRDADAAELHPLVEPELRSFPLQLLHGPASAARLRSEGVSDEALLIAVTYHTLGHAKLDALGRALYAADFLEPGRSFEPEWRGALRARMPGALDDVVREILGARIKHLIDRNMTVRPETLGFWNALVTERDS